MKILTVIAFHKGDGAQAEKLCDWIFSLNNRQTRGHCLLVAASDTHAELVTKVQLAAEVAFKSVVVHVEKSNPPQTNQKSERVNKMFLEAADFVHANYRWPFLFLEPDCVPLKAGWFESIENAYHNQPKHYMGMFLRFKNPDRTCLSRMAVYPNHATTDLKMFCIGAAPFNMAAGQTLIAKASKNPLFQHLEVRSEEDASKVRPDAALLHHDKKGWIIRQLRNSPKQMNVDNGEFVPVRTITKATRLAA